MTPAISDYLDKKLGMLGKYVDLNDPSVRIHVILGKMSSHHKTGDVFKVEVDLHMKGTHLHAESEKADLYAAIDDVKDELAGEIKKNKERRTSRVRRGAEKIKKMLRASDPES